MLKIGDVTDTADDNGEFTDGNVAGNVLPTELMAAWFTTVQRELIAVLSGAGINPDKNNDAQVVEAIKKMIKDSSTSVDSIYPVGIVTFFAENKNPNALFPGTTWKYIGENKTIRLGKQDGSDILTTGGADSVTLAVGNIPGHGHTFSATTSSFDYSTKTSNSTGAHTHSVSGTAASAGDHAHKIPSAHGTGAGNAYVEGPLAADEVPTRNAGAHTHTVSGTAASSGAHTHTVAIGAHTHTVSGTTANTGTGTAFAVTNSFVKLMGWYRSA